METRVSLKYFVNGWSKNKFYNTVARRAISHINYGHVLNVWEILKWTIWLSWFVLKSQFLFLACVFETFRKESVNSFELDPAHYLSTPVYIWDVLLKFTDVNLKLISDIEKYQFIERTIRDGISMNCKGYPEGKNKFLKPFDVNKLTSYIIYLDPNNL